MLSLTPATQIFLVTGATDMRKSFNGLVAIVMNVLGRDPLTGHIFVFTWPFADFLSCGGLSHKEPSKSLCISS